MSFPRVLAGRRRTLVLQLVANGLAQAAAAFAASRALHAAFAAKHPHAPLLLALIAAGAALAALRIHAAGTAERLGQDYVTRVRLRIFEASAAHSPRGVDARTGVTMSRVIGDLSALRNWVSEGMALSLVASVTITGALAALALQGSFAALALLGVAVGSALGAAALMPMLRRSVRETRRRRGRLANNLGEKLIASQTVRQLGQLDEELERVRRHSGWLRDSLVRRERIAEALRSLPELTTAIAIATWIALRGEAHPRELAAGMLVLGMVGSALRDLARALEHRIAFEEGRRRITELLAAPRLAEKRRARALEGEGPLALELVDVTVKGALHGASFAAKPGERVLVTGPAGAGKSTLLALAARQLDPDSGEVRLGGQPLRALALDSVHDAVQLVSPELPLLRGSVADNVSYGAEADDAEWVEAVTLACGLADDAGLPEGLATRVGERGANLSAGLRARVALARAVAMRPRLLLVDDPVFDSDAQARAALERVLALHPATALVVGTPGSLASESAWTLDAAGSAL